MLGVPVTLARLIVKFAPLLSKRVWDHAQVLVGGAPLAPGKRPVSAVLRVMGLSQERQFQNYPRVLKWARGASLAVARVLPGLVVHTFVPAGPVVMGIDDTLERQRGQKSKARGLSHAPVRSSRSPVVKARGLRWLCALLLPRVRGRGASGPCRFSRPWVPQSAILSSGGNATKRCRSGPDNSLG